MPIGHIEETAPGALAAHILAFADSADHRLKAIDAQGNKHILSRYGVEENVLVNGGFDFWQRQSTAASATYNSATTRSYFADRWALNNENASVTAQRADSSAAVETALHARYYARLIKITGAGKLTMVQIVEGHNTMPLRGRRVRLSFNLRRTTATAIKLRLGLLALGSGGTIDTVPATLYTDLTTATGTDPTLGANVTQLTPVKTEATGTIVGNGVDCVLTTSWQRFSATFDVPTTCKNVIAAVWSDADLAINDEIDVTEAMLTDGEEFLDWTPRAYAQELALCQRYYFKTFNVDTAPAASVGVNSGEFQFQGTVVGVLVMAGVGFRYPVPMRAAGTTLTTFNVAAAGAQARDITDGVDQTATAITANGEQGCRIACTGAAGNAAGEHIAVHFTVEVEL